MKPDDLMMSDVPWAVAWYGDRQCVWNTLDAQTDFFAINDYLKPVQALYFTPLMMDGKFVSDWVEGSERSWGGFIAQGFERSARARQISADQVAPTGFLPDRLFLTDRERWRTAR